MATDRIKQETKRVYSSLELRGLCDKDSGWVSLLWDSNLCQIEDSLQGNGELVQLLERLLQSPLQLKEVVSVTKDWICNDASHCSVFNGNLIVIILIILYYFILCNLLFLLF